MQVVYLHGFGSSPRSGKAVTFTPRFAEYGITLRAPDLNVPSFEHLNMTAILQRLHAEITALPSGEPVILIGSSLGGAVAVNYADKHHYGMLPEGQRISHLILLAPALDPAANWRRRLGETGMAAWQSSGWTRAYHHAHEREMDIHYWYYQSLTEYAPMDAEIDKPVLIIHGSRDEVVPVDGSIQFAQARSHVDLRVVDGDHGLMDQTDAMWTAFTQFLSLATG